MSERPSGTSSAVLARRRGRRDDAGQVVTAVLVLVVLGLLVVAVQVLLPVGRAADLKERAQAAADAAALAGAQDVKREVITRWSVPLIAPADLDNWLGCPNGAGEAAAFAGRNDARVTRYCHAFAIDRVQARVEGNTPLDGRRPLAAADARLGIPWSACRLRPDPAAPLARVIYDCGSLEVPFDVEPVTGRLTIDVPPGFLEGRLTPRLVG
jgi:hypothetical protein